MNSSANYPKSLVPSVRLLIRIYSLTTIHSVLPESRIPQLSWKVEGYSYSTFHWASRSPSSIRSMARVHGPCERDCSPRGVCSPRIEFLPMPNKNQQQELRVDFQSSPHEFPFCHNQHQRFRSAPSSIPIL